MLSNQHFHSTPVVNFDLLAYTIGSYHYNWHPQIELFWLLQGHVEVNVDGRRYDLKANDLILINANCGHATFALDPECLALRLHIAPAFYTNQGLDLSHGAFHLNSVTTPQHRDYQTIRQILAQLYTGLHQSNWSAFELNAAYFQLTNLLHHDFFDTQATIAYPQPKKQSSLSRGIDNLNQHYDQPVTLESAAAISHYSTAYLSRIFKAELGINFYEYLTRCRLQHAIADLEDPNRKIADVALKNGFQEVKSFNLMFKRHFGQTPSNYREHLSKGPRSAFKQPLTPTQTAWVQAQMTHWAQLATVDQLSACESCAYKLHFEEYQALKTKVAQLKNLLNQ